VRPVQAGGGVRVLEADPELGAALPPEQRRRAERWLVAGTARLSRGAWEPPRAPAGLGLLVLEGGLACRVSVGRRRSLELLGAGDLVPPAGFDAFAVIPQRSAWRAVVPTTLAVLDADFSARCARFPSVVAELGERGARRVESFALRLAIAQLPSLEERLEVLLWHLADRWGTRERDAVVLRLPLSQEMLAELAAAQRTSVCAALQALGRRGRVCRRPGRRWALHGDPPAAFSAAL
jgi:CRP/FNR family transcriptional regulator, cyclic AMP receptor protein